MRNDPRLRCVAVERNKWYEKYVELEWNKQDSTAAYASSNTGISSNKKEWSMSQAFEYAALVTAMAGIIWGLEKNSNDQNLLYPKQSRGV